MDEKLVEQVSSTSGIPQMLVSRSAQARAEASGVSVNDVLNSWTGGEAIQAAPANETVSESQVVVEDTPTPVEEQVDEPVEVEAVSYTHLTLPTLKQKNLKIVLNKFKQQF